MLYLQPFVTMTPETQIVFVLPDFTVGPDEPRPMICHVYIPSEVTKDHNRFNQLKAAFSKHFADNTKKIIKEKGYTDLEIPEEDPQYKLHLTWLCFCAKTSLDLVIIPGCEELGKFCNCIATMDHNIKKLLYETWIPANPGAYNLMVYGASRIPEKGMMAQVLLKYHRLENLVADNSPWTPIDEFINYIVTADAWALGVAQGLFQME